MKKTTYTILAITLVLGISFVGYAASGPAGPQGVFPQTYTAGTGTSGTGTPGTGIPGTTMQEACITHMADMGMGDETIQMCADMMDQMGSGHPTDGPGHSGMGFMDRMKGMMTGMMGDGMCKMGS